MTRTTRLAPDSTFASTAKAGERSGPRLRVPETRTSPGEATKPRPGSSPGRPDTTRAGEAGEAGEAGDIARASKIRFPGASPRGSGTLRRPASWTRASRAPAGRSRRRRPGSTASCRTTSWRIRTRGSTVTSCTGASTIPSCRGGEGSGASSKRSRRSGQTFSACRSARTFTASPRLWRGAGTRGSTRRERAGEPTEARCFTGPPFSDAPRSRLSTLPTLTSARTPRRWRASCPRTRTRSR